MIERVWMIEESSEVEGYSGNYTVWHINPLLGYYTDLEDARAGLEEHRRSEDHAQRARLDDYYAKSERVRQRAVKAQRQGFQVATSEYPPRPVPLPKWRLIKVERAAGDL